MKTLRKRGDSAPARLAAVVRHSEDAIISKTLKGVITSWNPAAERVFGYSASEAVGHPITLIIPPERLHEEEEVLRRLRRGETVDHFETVRVRKDGVPVAISLSVSPIRDAAGRIVGASKIARDITGRKRAEEQQARLAAILEFAQDAILATTLDSVLTAWNPAAARLFGYSAAEAIGQPNTIIVPPDRRHEESEVIDRICRGESVDQFETVRLTKSGQRIDVSSTVSPIRDAAGHVIGASEIVRDITERKQADAALRRSEVQYRALSRRLETAREEERTAVARELHDELGQSLTTIKLDTAGLLSQLPEESVSLRELAGTLLRRVDSLFGVLHRIVSELRPGALDVLGLSPALGAHVRDFASHTGMTWDYRSAVPDTELDRERSTAVFRIVQEALTNVARHARATRVDVTLAKEDRAIVVTVRDNGRGITEEALTAPRSLGLLGMAERARAFGGDVDVTGESSGGTTVIARIPL